MRLKDVDLRMLFVGVQLVVTAEKEYTGELFEIVKNLGVIDREADYEIIIRKKRKQRSLDQNAYAWKLIGELSRKLRRSPAEVYRELIRDMPTYEIVPVADRAVNHWCESWESRGLGWICEDMGACRRTEGYRNIKCFYGSSTFTKEEMGQLIDLIIEECHAQGIGTLTPKEIAELGDLK